MSKVLNLNVAELKNLECSQCKGILFTRVFIIKIIPRMMVGTAEDTEAEIPLWQCANCKHVMHAEKFVNDGKPKIEM